MKNRIIAYKVKVLGHATLESGFFTLIGMAGKRFVAFEFIGSIIEASKI